MIFYLDSSVVIRKILNESGELPEFANMQHGVSSRLLRLECLRALERYRWTGQMTDEQIAMSGERCFALLQRVSYLPVTRKVWQRAEAAFSTPVKTLDSLHLATALLWQETRGRDFMFATHDAQLGRAARAYGLKVIGL